MFRNDALAEDARVPVMYYHIPQTTKVAIGAGTIAALHADGAIQGIKDSSGVAPFLSRVITATRHDAAFRPTVGGPFYLVGAMSLIGTFDSGNERGAAMTTAYTTRVCNHIVDAGCGVVLDRL